MYAEIAKLVKTHQLNIEDFWLDRPIGKKHRRQIIKVINAHNGALLELAHQLKMTYEKTK